VFLQPGLDLVLRQPAGRVHAEPIDGFVAGESFE
jgi:hypothetical protein